MHQRAEHLHHIQCSTAGIVLTAAGCSRPTGTRRRVTRSPPAHSTEVSTSSCSHIARIARIHAQLLHQIHLAMFDLEVLLGLALVLAIADHDRSRWTCTRSCSLAVNHAGSSRQRNPIDREVMIAT